MYTKLPSLSIEDPSILDELFAQMHCAEKIPMDEDQAEFSIPIMATPESSIDYMYAQYMAHWQSKGFFKRCELFPIKYEKRLLVWLAVMTYKFGIGGMILVAYYVQWCANKLLEVQPGRELTLHEVSIHIFTDGVFSKQTVHEFWDKQKVDARPDNLIDYPLACTAFMKIERTEPITYKDH